MIDIVEELNVLFFCLDERSDDFVDIIDSCCFHNCLKSFLNDLSVAHVLVKQALFLDVLVNGGIYTNLENLNRVSEFLLCALTLLSFHCATQTFVIEFDFLIFGFKLFLKITNVLLELFFTFLVLAFES